MKTVIEMAREAGCIGPGAGGDPNGLWEPNGHENVTELMVRFAELVRADEREACAKMCDAFQARDVGMQPAECAGAIRARSQK